MSERYPCLTHSVVVLTALDYAERHGLDFEWTKRVGLQHFTFDVVFLERHGSRHSSMSYATNEDFGADMVKIIQQRCEGAIQELKNDT